MFALGILLIGVVVAIGFIGNNEPNLDPNQSKESALKNARKLKRTQSGLLMLSDETVANMILRGRIKPRRGVPESASYDH